MLYLLETIPEETEDCGGKGRFWLICLIIAVFLIFVLMLAVIIYFIIAHSGGNVFEPEEWEEDNETATSDRQNGAERLISLPDWEDEDSEVSPVTAAARKSPRLRGKHVDDFFPSKYNKKLTKTPGNAKNKKGKSVKDERRRKFGNKKKQKGKQKDAEEKAAGIDETTEKMKKPARKVKIKGKQTRSTKLSRKDILVLTKEKKKEMRKDSGKDCKGVECPSTNLTFQKNTTTRRALKTTMDLWFDDDWFPTEPMESFNISLDYELKQLYNSRESGRNEKNTEGDIVKLKNIITEEEKEIKFTLSPYWPLENDLRIWGETTRSSVINILQTSAAFQPKTSKSIDFKEEDALILSTAQQNVFIDNLPTTTVESTTSGNTSHPYIFIYPELTMYEKGNEYCKQEDGMFLVVKNEKEEREIFSWLKTAMKQSQCEMAFLGIKRKKNQWRFSNGTIYYSAYNLISAEPPGFYEWGQCVTYTVKDKIVKHVPCTSSTGCFVCETDCENPPCLISDMSPNYGFNFPKANHLCKRFPGGRLAIILDGKVTPPFRQIGFPCSLKSVMASDYETFTRQDVPYVSSQTEVHDLRHECLLYSVKQPNKWVGESCDKPACLLCRKSTLIS